MERIAGCCRAISNIALDQRRWFARPGRSISYEQQAGEIAELKAEFSWFAEAPYHCLQQALVDKAGFEEAVGRYLQSEFRVPFADRSLLTVAFDLEITAYLKQIYERNFFTRQSVASVMNRAPIVTWLIGRFWALLRFAIIAVAVLAAIHFSWISEQAAFWVVVVAFGLLAGGTIISFISYLSFRQRWTASKQVLVDLPRAMVGFFGEVHSTGPLSIRRVREQSQKLADMGTVWPGVVWALLDDLEARGVISLHG